MKKIVENKGITLIALVITVIIMLILAGVAISAITGADGLISRTKESAEKYNNAVTQENEKVQTWENILNEYMLEMPIPIASKVKVGDYVDYDAGTWSEDDFTKITESSGDPTVNQSTDLPETQGQFGGFVLNQSRNTNSTPWLSSCTPKYSGWRVWDKNDETGVVTLISAGHPETYYHSRGSSETSINILRNRECSMYVNKYATGAKILTGEEAARWYNKQYGTNYTLVENGEGSLTFYNKEFSTEEPISVLENGSDYWLASTSGSFLSYVTSYYRAVGSASNSALGIRFIVFLKPDLLIASDTGDGSVDNPWKLAGN